MEEKKQKKNKWKTALLVLVILLVFVICIGVTAAALMLMGRKHMTSSKDAELAVPEKLQVAAENNGKTVVYDGQTYELKENVTSILCIGVDREALEEQAAAGYGGQADSLFLAVLDGESRQMSIIGISRDSIVGVDVYDTTGNYVETKDMQLCLSYGYGNGMETSCENTVKSASRLLYGIPIQGYVAIDMAAIGELNDLVGGVVLNPGEDRKYFDFSRKDGELVHLTGREAEVFVRFRDTDVLESNAERIRRQKTYLLAFANTVLAKTKEDLTTPVKLYQEISDDIVTNLSVSDISYLASQAVSCEISMDNLTVIQGEITSDGTYAAFYPDEQALYELILKTYYNLS